MLAEVGLGRRREDRLRQPVRKPQPGRQRDPADRPALLVVLPAAAGQVAAHDALHRERLGLEDEHRASLELVLEAEKVLRELAHVGRHHVVLDYVRGLLEPERRQLVEHVTLAGDALGHDHVEGRDSVGADYEEEVAHLVDVSHLAPREERQAEESGIGDDFHCASMSSKQVPGERISNTRLAVE